MSKSIEMRVEELENLVFLSKNVLSFEEASKFLNKMLYFEKAELEAWLRQNPVKTQAQIEQEAQKYVLNRPLKK